MQLFYEEDITTNGGYLDPTESIHCTKALRHKAGDEILIINGKGQIFKALIKDANPKKCRVEIVSQETQSPSSVECHIAIAPTKNMERTEWFVEKSTELGIETITPIVCRNSERKTIKAERLGKVVISAIKQSGSLWRPLINELSDFDSFIEQQFEGDKFIAHCHSGNEPHLKDLVERGNNTLVLIGPEGDFTIEEVKRAEAMGFKAISLGPKRLRTETAALAACHIIRLENQ